MPKKYRFRKVYFICRDNSIFENFEVINCFKRKQYVDGIYKSRQAHEDAEVKMLYNPKGKTPKQLTVHGFYLVHESLFDELLRDSCKEVIHQ